MKQTKEEQMKTRFSLKRAVVVVALAATLGGVYFVRVAYTADPRLDLASDHVTQAIALLEATDIPADAPHRCEKCRRKAIKLLEQALDRIGRTKTCVDESMP
jgi:hypothetical protein